MIGAAVLLALVGASGEIDLTWTAPDDACPSRDRVVARIGDLVGRPLDAKAETRLRARVNVERTQSSKWRADLYVASAGGETTRRLEDPKCDAVAEAVAVILALAVDTAAKEAPKAGGAGSGSGSDSGSGSTSTPKKTTAPKTAKKRSTKPRPGGESPAKRSAGAKRKGGSSATGSGSPSGPGPGASSAPASDGTDRAGAPSAAGAEVASASASEPGAEADGALASGASSARMSGPESDSGPATIRNAAGASGSGTRTGTERAVVRPGAETTPPTKTTRLGLHLAGQWAWEAGMLPASGARLQLGAGLALGRFTLEVGVDLRATQTIRVPPVGGADVSATGLHAALCYDAPLGTLRAWGLRPRTVSVALCAGGEGARMTARAFGTTNEDPQRAFYGAYFAELGPRARIFADVWLTARVRVLALARRPEVRIDDAVVFAPPAVGVSGAFGIEVFFGDG